MAVPLVFLGVLLLIQDGHTTAPRSLVLDPVNKRVMLPMSKGDQSGTVKVNGTLIAVQDSHLPAVLLSLYQNISREILTVPDVMLRNAFKDSLEVTLLKSIENLVVPGLDDKRKAKIRQLKFGGSSDSFYTVERVVLVSIIVVVVVVSTVVFVYWFVTTVLQVVLRRGRSDIGLTELDDLDVYSTDVDDDASSLTRQIRNKRGMKSRINDFSSKGYEALR